MQESFIHLRVAKKYILHIQAHPTVSTKLDISEIACAYTLDIDISKNKNSQTSSSKQVKMKTNAVELSEEHTLKITHSYL